MPASHPLGRGVTVLLFEGTVDGVAESLVQAMRIGVVLFDAYLGRREAALAQQVLSARHEQRANTDVAQEWKHAHGPDVSDALAAAFHQVKPRLADREVIQVGDQHQVLATQVACERVFEDVAVVRVHAEPFQLWQILGSAQSNQHFGDHRRAAHRARCPDVMQHGRAPPHADSPGPDAGSAGTAARRLPPRHICTLPHRAENRTPARHRG